MLLIKRHSRPSNFGKWFESGSNIVFDTAGQFYHCSSLSQIREMIEGWLGAKFSSNNTKTRTRSPPQSSSCNKISSRIVPSQKLGRIMEKEQQTPAEKRFLEKLSQMITEEFQTFSKDFPTDFSQGKSRKLNGSDSLLHHLSYLHFIIWKQTIFFTFYKSQYQKTGNISWLFHWWKKQTRKLKKFPFFTPTRMEKKPSLYAWLPQTRIQTLTKKFSVQDC